MGTCGIDTQALLLMMGIMFLQMKSSKPVKTISKKVAVMNNESILIACEKMKDLDIPEEVVEFMKHSALKHIQGLKVLEVAGKSAVAIFEEKCNVRLEYENLVKLGQSKTTKLINGIEVSIKLHEFDYVDPNFISFVLDMEAHGDDPSFYIVPNNALEPEFIAFLESQN
jgi:hypothetical protein